jgi:Flp pilus assembly protein TadG
MKAHSAVRPTRKGHGRRGAALVESSLLLPLFLIFWFGIVDWGLAFFAHQTVIYRVTDAARWAVVNDYDPVKIKAKLLYDNPASSSTAGPWWSLNQNLNVNVQLTGSTATQDQRVVITVSNYQWLHFTPFLAGRYFGAPITVSIPAEDMKAGI